jgi:hypothetical protein
LRVLAVIDNVVSTETFQYFELGGGRCRGNNFRASGFRKLGRQYVSTHEGV